MRDIFELVATLMPLSKTELKILLGIALFLVALAAAFGLWLFLV